MINGEIITFTIFLVINYFKHSIIFKSKRITDNNYRKIDDVSGNDHFNRGNDSILTDRVVRPNLIQNSFSFAFSDLT